jgi:hypothetical protein
MPSDRTRDAAPRFNPPPPLEIVVRPGLLRTARGMRVKGHRGALGRRPALRLWRKGAKRGSRDPRESES